MIAMKVRNEDMVDFSRPQVEPSELHLCSFAAINQEMMIVVQKELGAGIPSHGGSGGTCSEHREVKGHE
jgi:hypothetical protein